MFNAFTVFVYNLPSILFGLIGGYLCFLGKEGWGWFIFLAFCTFVTVKIKKTDNEQSR